MKNLDVLICFISAILLFSIIFKIIDLKFCFFRKINIFLLKYLKKEYKDIVVLISSFLAGFLLNIIMTCGQQNYNRYIFFIFAGVIFGFAINIIYAKRLYE